MEDLEDVRRRMQSKKQPQVLTNRSFEKFYRFAIGTMSLIAIALITSCFIKANPDMDVLTYLDEHILTLLPTIDFNQDKEVSTNYGYEWLSNQTYRSNDENIYALEEGIVKEVSESQIVVLYQNGITATYSQFASSQVKAYDRIKKNETLGTYEQNFTMVLEKNGIEVSYEEIFT